MTNFRLIYRSGNLAGQEKSFPGQELMIGRDPAHQMVIDDVQISRDHLRIFIQDGHPFLEDLNSTNGTFVNGKRINKPTHLRNGDLISLGENHVFEFSWDAADIEPESSDQGQPHDEMEPVYETSESTLETDITAPKDAALKAKQMPGFLSSLPTWAVILFIAIGFFLIFCLVPFVIIEATDQWCNLFSGFFNAMSPGICP